MAAPFKKFLLQKTERNSRLGHLSWDWLGETSRGFASNPKALSMNASNNLALR
jgi:hypothetical protein